MLYRKVWQRWNLICLISTVFLRSGIRIHVPRYSYWSVWNLPSIKAVISLLFGVFSHAVTEVIVRFIHRRAARSLKSHMRHIRDIAGSYSNFQITLQGKFHFKILFSSQIIMRSQIIILFSWNQIFREILNFKMLKNFIPSWSNSFSSWAHHSSSAWSHSLPHGIDILSFSSMLF